MKPIYLDYQSSTPTDENVLKKMIPYFSEVYGNPHSSNHQYGLDAYDSTENGRKKIAQAIGAQTEEIIFTSGATESNNLAIKGSFLYRKKKHNRKKIIIAATEHKCVIEAANSLTSLGALVSVIDVNDKGEINLDQLKSEINSEVALVSIMLANNEIGIIHPIKKISKICKKFNVWLHSDAAQALGNMDIKVNDLGVDLLSISSHKLYGPKGIGCLFVRRRPRIRLFAQIDGGGQERLMRSGTLPTPLIVGFSEAMYIANQNLEKNIKKLKSLRERLHNHFLKFDNKIILNGTELNKNRLPNNLNYLVEGVNAIELTESLGNHVAFSTGSACSTGSIEPSYVLTSIGLAKEQALSSFRISVGLKTTPEEVDEAAKIICSKIDFLRK
ncbi:MAG: IscS subfamily cysteine desulfurase [Pelagibacterales bacterium]|nr:IscS subfamily cysteine desulfurase [Pelagibacterales bacterium]PPR16406.1 MAG: Cysteine desulfurase IscS [Alphaproteobacteria bacterium MarineAlpha9_Bin3]|tara:strand:+ start:22364 stop:23521 length:1158 start_codon:yes stop_codon:yes gene_type:complete